MPYHSRIPIELFSIHTLEQSEAFWVNVIAVTYQQINNDFRIPLWWDTCSSLLNCNDITQGEILTCTFLAVVS